MTTEWMTRSARARLLVLAVLALLSGVAYYRMFAQFAPYDDEGYVMQTIHSYLSGAPLYDVVFSQYGPAFYVYAWIVHGLLSVPLTDDAVRLITIGWWLAGSALGAAIVFRLTRSVTVTAFSAIVVFVHLRALVNEPGHPQAVLAIVVLLCCLISSRAAGVRDHFGAAACGALTAFAVLVKINVGLFLGLGLLLAFVLASALPMFVLVLAVATCALVPFAIMRAHLGSFAMPYAVAASTGVLTVSLTMFRPLRKTNPTWRPLVTFCGTAIVTAVVLIGPALARGTTAAALFRATITDPQRLASVFVSALVLPRYTYSVCAVSLSICALYALSAAVRRSGTTRGLIAACKLAAIWVLITTRLYVPFFVFLTPLLWIVLIDASATDEQSAASTRTARATIALIASFETLQAYPVAGSQLAFATDVAVILSLVGIDDAFRVLTASRPAAVAVAVRVAVLAAAIQLGRPAFGFDTARADYRAGYELRLPGASRLRLSEQDVASLQWLTATAHAQCDRLLTLPGLYSLNAWSGVPPPTDANVTAWHVLFSSGEQSRVWSALDRSSRPCVIVRPALAKIWASGRALEQLDAGAHLRGRRALGAAGDFRLLDGAGTANVPVELMMGRQSFASNRTPVPIAAALIRPGEQSTLRLWFRTDRPGVIVSCQHRYNLALAAPMVPIVYVDIEGRLRSAELDVRPPERKVSDGRWHYVAIVRDGGARRLYVDDQIVSARTEADEPPPAACQVGNGFLRDRPDAPAGWMPFTGDVASLAVASHAWTGAEVAADRQRTHID